MRGGDNLAQRVIPSNARNSAFYAEAMDCYAKRLAKTRFPDCHESFAISQRLRLIATSLCSWR